jgi:hypothetical protein
MQMVSLTDILSADAYMKNVEDPVPENEPTGMAAPSTDVLLSVLACLNVRTAADVQTRAPVCPNVMPNVEWTSADPNTSPSRTFTKRVPLPKKKKTCPQSGQQSNNVLRGSQVHPEENYAKRN